MGIYDGFDDFDGDFGDYDGGDFDGDSYDDGGFDHDGDTSHDEPSSGGLQWQDWMIIGPLSEEIAEEKKEKDRIYRDTFGDDIFDVGP